MFLQLWFQWRCKMAAKLTSVESNLAKVRIADLSTLAAAILSPSNTSFLGPVKVRPLPNGTSNGSAVFAQTQTTLRATSVATCRILRTACRRCGPLTNCDDNGDGVTIVRCLYQLYDTNDYIPIVSALNGLVRFIQFPDVMTSLPDGC